MTERNASRKIDWRPLAAVALGGALILCAAAPAAAQNSPISSSAPAPTQSNGAAQGEHRLAQEDRMRLGRELINMLLQPAGDQSAPQHQIPLATNGPSPEIELSSRDGLVSIIVRNASVREVLSALAQSQRLNIVCPSTIDADLSITLQNVPLEDALTSIVSTAGATWRYHNGIIHVTSLAGGLGVSPEIQGLVIKSFPLDFVAAEDLEPAIINMLSPLGQANALRSTTGDNRRTTDLIVVEDLPSYVARIGHYIQQVDQPPRQVLIEVHVLEVELEKDDRCGVDFDHIMQFAGHDLTFQMAGMATPLPQQAFSIELDGGNLNAVLEALRTTTDAKTLASPRVLVINGQEARIQVGEQLGFRVTTTTETSTLESVDFLDVGVVLSVTPRISRDHRVMLRVRPEVSSGQVNPDTGLPEEETTEVQTDVLLSDGHSMIIAGLIQESDTDTQTKLKWLGDLYGIGKLFQRNIASKKRSEIIIALTPRIVPYQAIYQEQVDVDIHRVQTPLLHGALERFPRPWEPRFPHPIDNPTMWRLPPVREYLPPALHMRDHRRCAPCEAPPPHEQQPPPANPLPIAPEEIPLNATSRRAADQSSRFRPGDQPHVARGEAAQRWPSLAAPVFVDSGGESPPSADNSGASQAHFHHTQPRPANHQPATYPQRTYLR